MVVLPEVATDNEIHKFIYSLQQWLKGLVEAQA